MTLYFVLTSKIIQIEFIQYISKFAIYHLCLFHSCHINPRKYKKKKRKYFNLNNKNYTFIPCYFDFILFFLSFIFFYTSIKTKSIRYLPFIREMRNDVLFRLSERSKNLKQRTIHKKRTQSINNLFLSF